MSAWAALEELDADAGRFEPAEVAAIVGRAVAAGLGPSTNAFSQLASALEVLVAEPSYADEIAESARALAGTTPPREALWQAIEVRTRIEWTRIAAEAASGQRPDDGVALHPEDDIATAELDALLAEHGWRATAFNSERARLAIGIGPTFRHRFDWLVRGLGIDAAAAGALPSVAALVAAFPEARGAFEQHARLDRVLRANDDVSPDTGESEPGTVLDLFPGHPAPEGRVARIAPAHRLAAAGEIALQDPFAEVPVVYEDDAIQVRAGYRGGRFGVRVIAWAADAPSMDAPASVHCVDDTGAEMSATGGQALPTLWWACFDRPPVQIKFETTGREISIGQPKTEHDDSLDR